VVDGCNGLRWQKINKMGVSGIEHRTADSVIQAYNRYDCCNFSIWAGKRLCVKHDSGNSDIAIGELNDFLNTISGAQTQTVYTLRVYADSVDNINSNTAYEGSTTFCLMPAGIPRGENGISILPIQGQNVPAKIDPAKDSEIAKLRAENEALIKQVHNKELQMLRQEFDNKISGLQNQKEEKSGWEKFWELLDKNSDKVINTVEKFIEKLGGESKDYIVNKEPKAISGTTHTSQNSDEMIIQRTGEGALINPFIKPEESGLTEDQKNDILKLRLKDLNQENHDDIQSDCLEIIEERIGAETTSLMLLKVASLSNKDLNKLLSHLD
jgi:hypothetical protein